MADYAQLMNLEKKAKDHSPAPFKQELPISPSTKPERPNGYEPSSSLPHNQDDLSQVKKSLSERAFARTTERPNGRRIVTRNSFEIYEDQMDSLRNLSYEEKKQGKVGSMSAMVREAIDTYILNKSSK
jgi:hypothetical protein